jgi:uncharacterized membrane protein YjjP (DUF1212 family)
VISKPTALAVLAIVVAAIGVAAMVAGRLMTAGVSFLAVSLIIYVREKSL